MLRIRRAETRRGKPTGRWSAGSVWHMAEELESGDFRTECGRLMRQVNTTGSIFSATENQAGAGPLCVGCAAAQ